MLLSEQSIVFLGAGSMAEALLRGIVEAKLVPPSAVSVLNRSNRARLEQLQASYGIRVPEMNNDAERRRIVGEADIIVLAMKPKDASGGIREFQDVLRPQQLLVSVVAGLSVHTMETLLGRPQPIVRTMPNTSSTIGLGATGLACSASVSSGQRDMAVQMLEAVGKAVMLDESQLNLVTGVSGSGPAYVYYLMEAMIEAGVEGGLAPQDARTLVLQTVLGAARMVEATGENPSELRAKVTSPNGTTYAALQMLDEYRFKEAIMNAIKRAEARAAEMGDDIATSVIMKL